MNPAVVAADHTKGEGSHMNNRILMVMPYRQYVRKAAAEGLLVFSIWDPDRIPPDPREEIARYSEELLGAATVPGRAA